jgi:hypothetical protein
MEKPDVASRQHDPSAPSRTRTAAGFWRRNWDVLGVVLLMLGSFPTVWLAQRTITLVPNLGLIDDNWHLDSTYKALRGIWIGRDVAFTHGPIFQWLSSIPARSMPLSVGGLYATWNTLPIWCAFLFAWLALRLVLPEQPPWKRFVLLLLLASFWETSLRTTFPVLLFALFLRAWYAVHEGRLRSAFAGVGGAMLVAIAFLVAGDTGTYATAAWIISFIAVAFEMRRDGAFLRKLLLGLGAFFVSFAVVAVVVNAFTAVPFDFKFWRESLAQVSVYRWATPAAMTEQGATHLCVALVIAVVVFAFRAVARRKGSTVISTRRGFLLGAFLFGLAVMQSSLVRSDIGHVIIGESAMIFFVCVILFSLEDVASTVGVLLVIGASMLFSRPVFRPSSVIRLCGELSHPQTTCPDGYNEFQQACYVEPMTPQMLEAGSKFLQQHSGANESVFVFPYQTMFGLASRRNVAGGLMQAYTASGPDLVRIEMSGLEGRPIPAALYMPDADLSHWSSAEVRSWSRNYLSIPVDGIPNFTRIPEVWFWMVRHYRTAEPLVPGVVGLVRDESRASRIAMQAQPIGLPAKTYAIDDRSSSTDIGTPNWPTGYDFLRMRLTVHYPVWWKLRKPERLQLVIQRADGSRDLQWVVLPPNVSTEIWFYPWEAPDLAGYFDADSSKWRLNSRPAIIGLQFMATPLDWVSEQPQAITIEAADAVRLVMSPDVGAGSPAVSPTAH